MSQEKEQDRSTLDIAFDKVRESLAPYFKGRKNADANLHEATKAVIASISHMITVRDNVKKRPLGATVMTEQASFGRIPPRNL